jgi:hypothetical protein
MNDEHQSAYYQAIAREFLRRRGAPFFLSPRDLSLIAAWEERAVPLQAILEGIERAFDGLRDRSRGTKRLGLAFCERHVERAMAQRIDRAAGRRKAPAPRSEKQGLVREAVERFLRSLRHENPEVVSRFQEALKLLSRSPADEEALERIDLEVDEILLGRAAPDEREAAHRDVLKDFSGAAAEEIASLARAKLLKSLRTGDRIPYVSLFYY